MKTILFVDEVAPYTYDHETLHTKPQGGTESTVTRVAEGLAATGLFYVTVEQHLRTEHTRTKSPSGVNYLEVGNLPHADYVISLRSPQTLFRAMERFPRAKHYNWHQDLMSIECARDITGKSGFSLLSLTNFHRTQIIEQLRPQGYAGEFQVKVLYNPIEEDLKPDETPVDRNKLVFFSSPHKGLEYTLQIYRNLRNFNKDFILHIANPGYVKLDDFSMEGVKILGPLPYPEVIKHVRSSLCVFYPNIVFPETFGCIFAESNAVGTPVVTHPIGSATEVLYHPAESLDCRNPKSVIDRVMAWHSGNRPKVKANPKFRLSAVIESWKRLLNV